ncbi:MAG: undecaprenyl-phosphate glucose phosphotransferase [Rhodoferax sp.]|nr:undecaprenyl-phosphate glucose phosphotransferase [Rhodoferax sp.]
MASLALVTVAAGEPLAAPYWMLAVLVFALTFPGHVRLQSAPLQLVTDVLLNWLWIVTLLLLAGTASGTLQEFPQAVLLHWLWAAPATEVAATLLVRAAAPAVLRLQGPRQRAILVGMNAQAMAFGRKLMAAPLSRIELLGYVDSRNAQRLSHPDVRLLGPLEQLASLVQSERVQLIYLSLPMGSQPRILQALDALKDTTASIYFVPDMFVTDLIQGHADAVCGTTVIAVCETPFTGLDGLVKRGSDMLFALLILLLISPLLLGIAIAIKHSTRGPVLFKQRRYGLDGQEIVVYKFRSMTVAEDGASVVQASRSDARITPLGAFLRRTSLDELPQFVNVLQGRMSIVGPRPHAVAHNEFYRKQIKGYMVRHKVKPGITGWAQVNGFRGETDTLDKMQGRIDCDLDYLRHWSLALDVQIIFRTIRLVLKDHKAY